MHNLRQSSEYIEIKEQVNTRWYELHLNCMSKLSMKLKVLKIKSC